MKKLIISSMALLVTTIAFATDPRFEEARRTAQAACETAGKNAVVSEVTVSHGSEQTNENRGRYWTVGGSINGGATIGTKTTVEAGGQGEAKRTSPQRNESNSNNTQATYKFKCE